MAAAALLRSVARKLARAPPPPPPPLPPLARGLRAGARSGPAGSLPPPTSSQIHHGMGRDRSVVGMAAAGLRPGSGAGLLPSLARKIARAPPQGHHHRLHLQERGLHSSTSPNPGASGSTPLPPPATSDKELIENLRFRLRFAKALAGAAGAVAAYLYFRALPQAKAQAYSRELSCWNEVLEFVTALRQQETEDVIKDVQINVEGTETFTIKHVQANVEATKTSTKDVQANVEVTEATIKDVQANVETTEGGIKVRQTVAAEINAALEPNFSKGENKKSS